MGNKKKTPIIIYLKCLVLCVLAFSYPENIMPDTEGYEPKTMTIGTNNVFEVGCGTLSVFTFIFSLL